MAKTPERPNIPPRRKGAATRPAGPVRRPVPQRAARQRAAQRRRRLLLIGAPVVAVIAIVVILAVVLTGSSSKGASAANWSTPTGAKVYGALGPEGVPLEVGPALGSANAGLTGATIDAVQCNSSEQLVYHHHIHLAIFVDGQPRSVPLGVGMVPPAIVSNSPQGEYASGSNTCLYWLHVHAQDGIVHIESPHAGNFVLQQVFAIWHQALSADQVGSYHGTVNVTVNGKRYTGDVTQIPLAEHTQIVLNVGGPIVTPPPINWSLTQL